MEQNNNQPKRGPGRPEGTTKEPSFLLKMMLPIELEEKGEHFPLEALLNKHAPNPDAKRKLVAKALKLLLKQLEEVS